MRQILSRALLRLRAFHREQIELQERRMLRDRPWEEALLHWSFDGKQWNLHGHTPPPADGRRRSTTRTGWCPAVSPVPTRAINLDSPVH
jgi:hypothetical protein